MSSVAFAQYSSITYFPPNQMADEDDDLSSRTDMTKSHLRTESSRSCTATPTPVSRAPVGPLIAEAVSDRSQRPIIAARVPSVRFSAEESKAGGEADGSAATAEHHMDTEESEPETSRPLTVSGRSSAKLSPTRFTSQRNPQAPLMETEQAKGEPQDQPTAVDDESDSHDSDCDEDPDESSEESTDESEDEELSESEEDSSFEAATESSDDEIPLRKLSGRRSTATRHSPPKPRKSNAVKAKALIPEPLEEEDDVIPTKSSGRSASNRQSTRRDLEVETGATAVSAPRSPLDEIRVQDSVSPLKGMASLQLKETEASLDLEQESRPEPVKKKKRSV